MNKAQKPILITDAKARLNDIILAVSWREISRKYFGNSASWLYHKLNGVKSDGTPGGGFTPEEAKQLSDALNATADRLRKAASSLT